MISQTLSRYLTWVASVLLLYMIVIWLSKNWMDLISERASMILGSILRPNGWIVNGRRLLGDLPLRDVNLAVDLLWSLLLLLLCDRLLLETISSWSVFIFTRRALALYLYLTHGKAIYKVLMSDGKYLNQCDSWLFLSNLSFIFQI